jgi:hypothetical protein
MLFVMSWSHDFICIVDSLLSNGNMEIRTECSDHLMYTIREGLHGYNNNYSNDLYTLLVEWTQLKDNICNATVVQL